MYFLIFTKLKNYEEKMIFACLLVILFVGRIGTGWSDGILIWASFFHILDSKKGDKKMLFRCIFSKLMKKIRSSLMLKTRLGYYYRIKSGSSWRQLLYEYHSVISMHYA